MEYQVMLEDTVRAYIISFALYALLPVIGIIIFSIKRNKKKVLLGYLCLALIIGMALSKIIPLAMDISSESYVTVNCLYDRYSSGVGRGFNFGYAYIHVNDKSMRINTPANQHYTKFPEGKYYGTVVYAKNSKTIVDLKIDRKKE